MLWSYVIYVTKSNQAASCRAVKLKPWMLYWSLPPTPSYAKQLIPIATQYDQHKICMFSVYVLTYMISFCDVFPVFSHMLETEGFNADMLSTAFILFLILNNFMMVLAYNVRLFENGFESKWLEIVTFSRNL